MSRPATDLTGSVFGRLTVLSRNGTASNNSALWLCKCQCGKRTTVQGYHLRRGMTRSCGCWRSEMAVQRIQARRMAKARWRAKPVDIDMGPDLGPLMDAARAALARRWAAVHECVGNPADALLKE